MSDLPNKIPKEQQSAYQRWEMTSFDVPSKAAVAAAAAAAAMPAPPPPEYPSPQALAAVHEQARLIGYEEGRAAGHADALALGKVNAAQELEYLKHMAQAFGRALAEADHAIAGDVLDVALHLAKCMLKTALKVKPELILPLVQDAIGMLPVRQQPALLMLHPDDAKLVRDSIGDTLDQDGWRVIEDGHIGRGGCKIDTASNQIDAQAQARWQRLTNALGKDLDWLAS